MPPRRVGSRGTENGPAVAQIAGVLATKSAKIERCHRALPREDWHLMKTQSRICSSNEQSGFYLSLIISISYKIVVVGGTDPFAPATQCMSDIIDPVKRQFP